MENETKPKEWYKKPNYRVFKIKYLGATNTKGSRISIKDCRFNKTKIISFDHRFNNIKEIAMNYLDSIGINIMGGGELDQAQDIVLSDNFTINLKGEVQQ